MSLLNIKQLLVNSAEKVKVKLGLSAMTWGEYESKLDEAMSEGGAMFYTPQGSGYKANTDLSVDQVLPGMYNSATELVSLKLTNWNPTTSTSLGLWSGSLTNFMRGCSKLTTVTLPKAQYLTKYFCRMCTALNAVQLGSIGYPVTSIDALAFEGCGGEEITFTIYVDATTMDGISAAVSGNSPFGAVNATIIYKNSTTGEVITT